MRYLYDDLFPKVKCRCFVRFANKLFIFDDNISQLRSSIWVLISREAALEQEICGQGLVFVACQEGLRRLLLREPKCLQPLHGSHLLMGQTNGSGGGGATLTSQHLCRLLGGHLCHSLSKHSQLLCGHTHLCGHGGPLFRLQATDHREHLSHLSWVAHSGRHARGGCRGRGGGGRCCANRLVQHCEKRGVVGMDGREQLRALSSN